MTKVPTTVSEIHAILSRDEVTGHRRPMSEIAELVHEWLNPLPPVGLTRVRIAIGFDDVGHWMAFGSRNEGDAHIRVEARHFKHGTRIVFIEADIPPPVEEPTVVGRVVP